MVLQFPPWRHHSHLAMVRDWFFPSHAKQDMFSTTISDSPRDMRQRAVDKVNLWLFKAGQLPPAIIATASLTEALLHDEERTRSLSGRVMSDSAMQSIYAMAFARFVNGFVDRDVARSHAVEMAREDTTTESEEELTAFAASAGKGESSMYAHAATIGMPQKFVRLRHQVTHADIPNLIYLRTMTEQALEWLWERWWIKNATGNPERAVRELEERQRISREARETRDLAKTGSNVAIEHGPYDDETQDVAMEGTLGANPARNEPDPSLAGTATTARKRKSTAIEDND